MLGAGTFAIGLAYVGFGVAPSLALACVAALVGGIGNGLQWPSLISIVQPLTPRTCRADDGRRRIARRTVPRASACRSAARSSRSARRAQRSWSSALARVGHVRVLRSSREADPGPAASQAGQLGGVSAALVESEGRRSAAGVQPRPRRLQARRRCRPLSTTGQRCQRPRTTRACSGRPRSCCWSATLAAGGVAFQRLRMAAAHPGRTAAGTRALGEWLSIETPGGELSASLVAIVLAMALLGPAPAAVCGVAAMS